VLVVNSAYFAPTDPQVPGFPIWFEAYPPTPPGNWSPANANITYRSSKVKIDEFNSVVAATVGEFANDPDVHFYDLKQRLAPGGEYNDFSCPYPNELSPLSACAGQEVLARQPDHGHISFEGYRDVVMPRLLPVIRQILS
jgi:hypothetical protein